MINLVGEGRSTAVDWGEEFTRDSGINYLMLRK
jgi:hypothetical protein